MRSIRRRLAVAALLAACAAPSYATTVALAADGQWNTFNVNDIDSLTLGTEWIDNTNTLSPGFGTPLSFEFTIAAGFTGALTVVDAGFAGDTFFVTNFGTTIGTTSAVPLQEALDAPDAGTDFDAAWSDAAFSRGVFQLGAGNYRITGALAQSVAFDGVALNSTVGGLKLTVAPVPEPATWLAMACGLGLLAARRRRG